MPLAAATLRVVNSAAVEKIFQFMLDAKGPILSPWCHATRSRNCTHATEIQLGLEVVQAGGAKTVTLPLGIGPVEKYIRNPTKLPS